MAGKAALSSQSFAQHVRFPESVSAPPSPATLSPAMRPSPHPSARRQTRTQRTPTELGYFRLLLFVVSTLIQSRYIYIIYILLKLHNQCTKNRGALLRQVVGWVFSDCFVVFSRLRAWQGTWGHAQRVAHLLPPPERWVPGAKKFPDPRRGQERSGGAGGKAMPSVLPG